METLESDTHSITSMNVSLCKYIHSWHFDTQTYSRFGSGVSENSPIDLLGN